MPLRGEWSILCRETTGLDGDENENEHEMSRPEFGITS